MRARANATLCLTLDVDWAADEVIRDTLEMVDAGGVAATWFFTHDTPLLGAAAARHEIGLHPNFNPVLDGGGDNARDVLSRLRPLARGARAIRSHSLVRGSRLATMFVGEGFTHESNVLVPPSVGAEVWAWRDWSGLVQVPIRWEDDVRLIDPQLGEPAELLGALHLLTVDFHPIHVFLNTATIAEYEAARPVFGDVAALRAMRRPARTGGTRDRLEDLMSAVREGQIACTLLSDLKPRTGC